MHSYSDGFSLGLGSFEEEPELDFEPEEDQLESDGDDEIRGQEVRVLNSRNENDRLNDRSELSAGIWKDFQVLSHRDDDYFNGLAVTKSFESGTTNYMDSDLSDCSDDLPVSCNNSTIEYTENLVTSESLNDFFREPSLTPVQSSDEPELQLPESPTTEMFSDSSSNQSFDGNTEKQLANVPDKNEATFQVQEDSFYLNDSIDIGFDNHTFDLDYPRVMSEESCSQPSTSTRKSTEDNNNIFRPKPKPVISPYSNGYLTNENIHETKEKPNMTFKPNFFRISLSGETRTVSSVEKPSVKPPIVLPKVVQTKPIVKNVPGRCSVRRKPKGIMNPPFIKQRVRKPIRKRPPERHPVKKICWREIYLTHHEQEFRLLSSSEDLHRINMVTSDSETSSLRSRTSLTSEPSSKPSIFKAPVKRPPTRPKPHACQNNFEEDQISVISLMTSASIFDKTDGCGEAQRRIPCENTNVFGNLVEQKQTNEKVADWLNLVDKGNVSLKNVPPVFLGICHKHFFKGNCQRLACYNAHDLFAARRSRIKELKTISNKEFEEAYDFAKQIPHFFIQILPTFAGIFVMKGRRDELIPMLTYVLEQNIPRSKKVEAFKNILEELTKINLWTLDDAQFFFMSHLGSRDPLFNQIALEAFILMEKPQISWNCIRKLFLSNERITDHSIATQFISSLIKDPVDSHLCHEVYKFLKSEKSLSFPSVDMDVRKKYFAIVQREADKEGISYPELPVQVNSPRAPSELPVPDDSARYQRLNFCPPKQIVTESPSTFPELPEFDKTKPPPNYFIRPPVFQLRNEPGSFSSKSAPKTKGVQHRIEKRRESFQFNPIEAPRTETMKTINSSIGNTDAMFGQNVNFNSDFASLRANMSNEAFPTFQGQARKRQYHSNDSEEDSFPGSKRQRQENSNLSMPSTSTPTTAAYNRWNRYSFYGAEYDPIRDYQYQQNNEAGPSWENQSPNFNDRSEGNSRTSRWVNQRPNFNERTGPNQTTRTHTWENQRPNSNKKGAFKQTTRIQELTNHQHSSTQERLESPGSQSPSFTSPGFGEQPRYGQIKYNEKYQFNKSLHHFYLEDLSHNDLRQETIASIYNCLRNRDGVEFLSIFDQHSDPASIRNFLAAVLTEYLQMNHRMTKAFVQLLKNLKRDDPLYMENLTLRAGLEVLAMNMLYFLYQRSWFKEAYEVLTWFPDFDTLVSSASLNGLEPIMSITLARRYLMIAMICLHTNPNLLVWIMTNSSLGFREHYDKWPYKGDHVPAIYTADMNIRNKILQRFFVEKYQTHIDVVLKMYRYFNEFNVWMFDSRPYIKIMFKDLINQESTDILRKIYPSLEMFQGVLDADSLRAYQIVMYKHLDIMDNFTVFRICQKKNVYPELVVSGVPVATILISPNFYPWEIELIILVYFHQLAESKSLPSGNRNLMFQVGNGLNLSSNEYTVLSHLRGVTETVNDIKCVLKTKINIECERFSNQVNVLIVTRNQLSEYLKA